MKPELEYGHWEIHPQVRKLSLPKVPLATPEMKAMTTMYEGNVYLSQTLEFLGAFMYTCHCPNGLFLPQL